MDQIEKIKYRLSAVKCVTIHGVCLFGVLMAVYMRNKNSVLHSNEKKSLWNSVLNNLASFFKQYLLDQENKYPTRVQYYHELLNQLS